MPQKVKTNEIYDFLQDLLLRATRENKQKREKIKNKEENNKWKIFPFTFKAAAGKIISKSNDKTCLSSQLLFYYFYI